MNRTVKVILSYKIALTPILQPVVTPHITKNKALKQRVQLLIPLTRRPSKCALSLCSNLKHL